MSEMDERGLTSYADYRRDGDRLFIDYVFAPPDLRGRYQGAFAVAFGAGRTLAPALGGAALEHVGPAALWAGCLVVALVAAAGHLVLGASRRAHQPTAKSAATPTDQPPTR